MKKNLSELFLFIMFLTICMLPFQAVKAAGRLELSETSIEIGVKEYGAIKIKSNLTGKKPSYSSSNTDIVSVSSAGTIYGKRKGTATITVTAGSSRASCKVTVTAASLELESNSTTLERDNTEKIKISKNTTGKTVSYKSSNTKIIKVSQNGNVKAVGEGNAYITATAGTHICRFNVTVPEGELLLEADSLSLNKGDRSSIILLKNTTGSVPAYQSSNSTIVSVSKNGSLKAKRAGTTRIKVSAGSKTAYVTITVTNKIYPTKIAFWDDEGEEGFWDHDYRYSVDYKSYIDIYPENATETQLTFTLSDTTLATVSDDGIVTPTKKGLGNVTLTATTENGLSDSIEITIKSFTGGTIEKEKVDNTKPDLDTAIICNGEKMADLGWTPDELLQAAGTPLRIEVNEYRGTTYVYRPRRDQLLHIYVDDDNIVKGYLIVGKEITAAGFTLGEESSMPEYIGYDSYVGDTRFYSHYRGQTYSAMIYYDRYKDCDIYMLEVEAKGYNYWDEAVNTRIYGNSEYEQMVCNELTDMINTYRAMYGLPDLKRDVPTDAVARQHAEYVVRENYFDHYTKDGIGPYERLVRAGAAKSYSAAENLGVISYAAVEDFQGLVSSKGHRENFLETRVNNLGIGYCLDQSDGEGDVVMVYLFQ